MKKLIIILFFASQIITAQDKNRSAFKAGEWLKFKISYSNFLGAGYATVNVEETKHNGKEAFHVKGFGKTTGVVSWFFKVRDDYQTYFYKDSLQPYRFIRKIDEGGYTQDKEILFNHKTKKAIVKNYKHKTEKTFDVESNVQDLVSTLYYLRNKDITGIQPGDELSLTMFFDEKNYNFKLRFLGRDTIRTKFGKVAALKFRPIVQAGRVFKEEEGLTVWITADENKIPLRIKASLAVGSLRADLYSYKGLANPFPMIFD